MLFSPFNEPPTAMAAVAINHFVRYVIYLFIYAWKWFSSKCKHKMMIMKFWLARLRGQFTKQIAMEMSARVLLSPLKRAIIMYVKCVVCLNQWVIYSLFFFIEFVFFFTFHLLLLLWHLVSPFTSANDNDNDNLCACYQWTPDCVLFAFIVLPIRVTSAFFLSFCCCCYPLFLIITKFPIYMINFDYWFSHSFIVRI